MATQRELTADEMQTISKNIDLAFDFLRDIIDDPAIGESLPSESTVELSETSLHDHRFRIAAHRPAGSDGEWVAQVVHHWTPTGDQHRRDELRPVSETPSVETEASFLTPSIWDVRAKAPTAAEAVERLTDGLDRAIDAQQVSVRQRRR